MTEESALKRNLTPLNIITALVLLAGTLFLVMQPKQESAPAAAADNPVLFTLGGKRYRGEDLPMRYSQPLYQSELEAYNNRLMIAQAAAIDLYVQQEAEKSGEDREQVARRLFDLQPPSEEQIRAFFDANRGAISGEFDQVRGEIAGYLMRMAQQAQQQALIEKLVGLNELSFAIEPPKSAAVEIDTAGYPSKGPRDAKVTVVEFADYQCPHCKSAHDSLKPVLEPYLDKVRFVYMDFPINRSGISRTVAEGAVCADQQQQFWAYQDLAFARQEQLSPASAREIAAELGLDLTAFDSCITAAETVAKVRHAEQQAIAAGVTGTPTFFVNGEKQHLHDAANELPKIIDQALAVTR